jgi:hypothetical protein
MNYGGVPVKECGARCNSVDNDIRTYLTCGQLSLYVRMVQNLRRVSLNAIHFSLIYSRDSIEIAVKVFICAT